MVQGSWTNGEMAAHLQVAAPVSPGTYG
jgi:hypothetical protein